MDILAGATGMLNTCLQKFVEGAPICVMARMALERTLGPSSLDELFRRTAQRQYEKQLLFSTLVKLMSSVVCGVHRSVNEAYQREQEEIAVSVTSVYNKLNGVEPQVTAELVRHSAAQMEPVIRKLGGVRAPWLRKHPVRILDGNHLAATEHRLEPLRTTRSGPLPGQALVVVDPQLRLVMDMVPCEDAHAQERSLVDEVLSRVKAGELWIADRNFCTTKMLFGLARRGAFFVIRQHASTLRWEAKSNLRPCGRAANGRLFEQRILVREEISGEQIELRRVVLKLDKPTRKGEPQIVFLTNLPYREASAGKVAELYKGRWTIEDAFGELAQCLQCEINTLGYPPAALFGFSLGLVAYNAVALVKAALAAEHGVETVENEVSGYYMSRELSLAYEGMMLAIAPSAWRRYGKLSVDELAEALRSVAGAVRLNRYRKHPRGPKKPRPPQTSGKRIKHVSTARLLAKTRRKTAVSVP
jgi:IS4 transposase